jgi:phosphatidylglycerophosphate synthase
MNVKEKVDDLARRASASSRSFFQWLLCSVELWICMKWPDTRPPKDQRVEGVEYPDTRPWGVRNLANIITTIRLSTFWIVPWGLVSSNGFSDRVLWLLMAVMLILSDGIDGEFARGLDTESRYGKAADPIADKLLVVSIAGGLAFEYASLYGWWATLFVATTAAVAIHEVMLAMTGAAVGLQAKRLGIDPHGSVDAGKVKFALQGFAIVFGWLCLNPVGLVVSTSALTLALYFSMQSRKAYIDQLKALNKLSPGHFSPHNMA